MDQARRWLYNIILSRVQQTTGGEYTVVVAPRARPRTVTKILDDGSRLEVELSWARDAPQVIAAERIFVVQGEEIGVRLPTDLIRLVAGKEPPAVDEAAQE